MALHFDDYEFFRRRHRLLDAMEERKLDGVLLFQQESMFWLTGYDGWSFYVHQGVLLGLEGEPVWWGRGMDAQGIAHALTLGAGQ